MWYSFCVHGAEYKSIRIFEGRSMSLIKPEFKNFHGLSVAAKFFWKILNHSALLYTEPQEREQSMSRDSELLNSYYEKIDNLVEVDYGDFKRKVGQYILALDESL